MADIKRMRRAMEATMNAVERLTRIIAEQDRGLRLLIEELKTTLENTAAEKRLARLDQFVKQHYLNPKSLKHDLIVWFVDGRWTTYNLGTANKKAFVTEFCDNAGVNTPLLTQAEREANDNYFYSLLFGKGRPFVTETRALIAARVVTFFNKNKGDALQKLKPEDLARAIAENTGIAEQPLIPESSTSFGLTAACWKRGLFSRGPRGRNLTNKDVKAKSFVTDAMFYSQKYRDDDADLAGDYNTAAATMFKGQKLPEDLRARLRLEARGAAAGDAGAAVDHDGAGADTDADASGADANPALGNDFEAARLGLVSDAEGEDEKDGDEADGSEEEREDADSVEPAAVGGREDDDGSGSSGSSGSSSAGSGSDKKRKGARGAKVVKKRRVNVPADVRGRKAPKAAAKPAAGKKAAQPAASHAAEDDELPQPAAGARAAAAGRSRRVNAGKRKAPSSE